MVAVAVAPRPLQLLQVRLAQLHRSLHVRPLPACRLLVLHSVNMESYIRHSGNSLEYVESQACVCIEGFNLGKIQPQKLLSLGDVLRRHLHPVQKKHLLAPKEFEQRVLVAVRFED